MLDAAAKLEIEYIKLLESHLKDIDYGGLARHLFPESGPCRRELYTKHMEFFRLGKETRERAFFGGNGTGKTLSAGGFELYCHATGDYPYWWEGRVFDHPIHAWASGDTKETVRDILQPKLFGNVAEKGEAALGTMLFPRETIIDVRFRANTNRAIDFVSIKHKSGGASIIGLKAYEQGWETFQGTEKHVVWDDEEPPMKVYTEGLMRTRNVGGIKMLTRTPLYGYSEVVKSFLYPEPGSSKVAIFCGMDDVPHLTEKDKEELLSSVPPSQRKARRTGYPDAGSGAIYTVPEDDFVIQPFQIPRWYKKMFALDHGIDNTAIAFFAYDPESDIAYLVSDYKRGSPELGVHAAAIKARGATWQPSVADAAQKERDGEQVVTKYRNMGLRMKLAKKGPGSVEGGILEMWQRLSTGRFKVFSNCQLFLEEYRKYARDEDGQIMKGQDDHILDACRYACIDNFKTAEQPRDLGAIHQSNELTFGIYG